MRGPDIYLYDITSQHTLFMEKILLTKCVGLREDRLRLILRGSILKDNQNLKLYNINNHSIILVAEHPRGGPKIRCTAVLRANDNSEVDLDSSDESNEDNKRTGECPLYYELGIYGTNCDNDDCEDYGTLYT